MSSPSNPEFEAPYEHTAQWYDAIYQARGRDSALEIDRISRYWTGDGRTPATRTILDAGCGSGAHLDALGLHGRVTGVDASSAMLEVAGRRPGAHHLEQADLRELALGTRFDLVVSLFGVCGYFEDREQLEVALSCLGTHVAPGGTLLVEPSLLEERFQSPRSEEVATRWGAATLTRSTRSRRIGSHLELDFEWRMESGGPGDPVDRVVRERHRMLLLSSAEWLDVATAALGGRFEIRIDPEGPIGRGLLVAVNRGGVRDTG